MKTIITNKKAFYDYILEKKKYQAGIVLLGTEVKSIRLGKVNFDNAYINIQNQEIFIINMIINKYKFNTCLIYYENRNKKLLLNKNEIIHIQHKIKTQGVTAIPLKLYFQKNLVKLEIVLAKGKKKHDKRNTLKERDEDLKIKKTLKYF